MTIYEDVPIILGPEFLDDEDIMKLNPFYEELRAFWNRTPPESTTTSPSAYSSKSTTDSSITSSYHLGVRMPFMSTNEHAAAPESTIDVCSACVEPERRRFPIDEASESGSSSGSYQAIPFEHVDSHKLPIPVASPKEIVGAEAVTIAETLFEEKTVNRKKLFGENGWLGSTADLEGVSKKNKKNVFGTIRKKFQKGVEDIAVDVARAYPIQFAKSSERPSIVKHSSLPTSLGPIEQAKLYSDMEVMILVTANKFLVQQYYEGRLSSESVKKVTNSWGSKGRPQVSEFQFDQATQRELLQYNIRTLNFNGECSTNPILLHSNLQNWKVIGKEMSVRTFCLPDSVIRKHMHDIHKILEMLGASLSTFVYFQELQVQALDLMTEQTRKSYYPENSESLSDMSSRLSSIHSRGSASTMF